MKTAIPLQAQIIAQQADTCQDWVLVSGTGENLELEKIHIAQIEDTDALLQEFKKHNVERILASTIGTTLIERFEQAGFQIFHGASGTLSDALNLIRLGILDSMAGSCGGGGCGGGCGSSSQSSCCGSAESGSEFADSSSCGGSCACGGK